jgi:hypothetical protein
MNLGAILGIASIVVIVGFIVFALRQGRNIKPGGSGDHPGSYSGSGGGGDGVGHGGDGVGH